MADNSALSRMFDAYLMLNPRKEGGRSLFPDDNVDVDLWEEDSYLAGLVVTVLKAGPVNVQEVRLSHTIDERLANAARNAHPSTRDRINAYVKYRKAMRELAEELSRVTGLKLRS